eukprot:12248508-Prorocentrum_lima.AAC.1
MPDLVAQCEDHLPWAVPAFKEARRGYWHAWATAVNTAGDVLTPTTSPIEQSFFLSLIHISEPTRLDVI